jgi:hypothetical protein
MPGAAIEVGNVNQESVTEPMMHLAAEFPSGMRSTNDHPFQHLHIPVIRDSAMPRAEFHVTHVMFNSG